MKTVLLVLLILGLTSAGPNMGGYVDDHRPLSALRPPHLSDSTWRAEPGGRGVSPAPAANHEGMRSPASVQGSAGVAVAGPLRVAVRGVRDGASQGTLAGIATWYDAPSVQDAAAGPPLRVGDSWRGSWVVVRYNGRSITVRLTDVCACHGRLIDLDDQAFVQLAPLSRGVLSVTVTRLGSIPLPQTDTEVENEN